MSLPGLWAARTRRRPGHLGMQVRPGVFRRDRGRRGRSNPWRCTSTASPPNRTRTTGGPLSWPPHRPCARTETCAAASPPSAAPPRARARSALISSGNAIGRAMLWLDMRGGPAIARRMRGRWLNVEGTDPWKLWRWLRLTGGAPADSGKDNAGHIAYIRDHEPWRYERTYKFLNVLDYMNLRLTGRFCATPNSHRHHLGDRQPRSRQCPLQRRTARHARRREARSCRNLVASTEVLGPLLPHVAESLGLRPDMVAVAGAIDTSAVAVGSGGSGLRASPLSRHIVMDGRACAVHEDRCVQQNRLRSLRGADRYLAVAFQCTAGANLAFLRDRILYHRG